MSERPESAECADVAPPDVLGVARGMLGDLDLEHVLERVLESARELAGVGMPLLVFLMGPGPGWRGSSRRALMSQRAGRSDRRRGGGECSGS